MDLIEFKQTREQWLESAVERLRGPFRVVGHEIPAVRVSTGFTGTRGTSYKAIGSCWNSKASDDGRAQIFISPIISDSVRVLDVLIHEIIHAIKPEAKHGKEFRKIAVAMGLTGKMTATVAGPELETRLNAMVVELGQYPHAKLNPADSGKKKQGTRLIKVSCEPCEYICRVSQTTIDQMGCPVCPACQESMRVSE